jgi:8-oxo-dGTP pyrophosphatase MutT (NUDIX family)
VKSREPRHYPQSAALPYRANGRGIEVLLVTSRSRRRWVIPKGLIEADLTPAASAAKEALEEAGVEGRMPERALGSYAYEKWGGICDVEVFPLAVKRVHETWEEDFRTREWVPLEEAVRRLAEADLKRLVEALPRVAC